MSMSWTFFEGVGQFSICESIGFIGFCCAAWQHGDGYEDERLDELVRHQVMSFALSNILGLVLQDAISSPEAPWNQ